jgi:hypothetical protein
MSQGARFGGPFCGRYRATQRAKAPIAWRREEDLVVRPQRKAEAAQAVALSARWDREGGKGCRALRVSAEGEGSGVRVVAGSGGTLPVEADGMFRLVLGQRTDALRGGRNDPLGLHVDKRS